MKTAKRIIRVGDLNTNNGVVTASGAPHVTVGDIPVALVGDPCSCHYKCVIVEGDAGHTINGIAVAYEGHKVSCGAELIASVENYSKEVNDALTYRLPPPFVAAELVGEQAGEPACKLAKDLSAAADKTTDPMGVR